MPQQGTRVRLGLVRVSAKPSIGNRCQCGRERRHQGSCWGGEPQQLLDRIQELEELLGLRAEIPHALGLTDQEERLLGLLMRRELVSRDTLLIALYSGTPDERPEAFGISKVLTCRLRKGLKPFGVNVLNKPGQGYYLAAEDKRRMESIFATLRDGREFRRTIKRRVGVTEGD